MVYSIIVIYFSNTNSTSASLDSAFCVRARVENAHASVCRVSAAGEFVNSSRNVAAGIVSVSHPGHVPLLVFARDETNERSMNSPRLTSPGAKAK